MLKHSVKAVVGILSLYILQSTLHAFTPPFQIEAVQTFPGSFYEQSAHQLIERFESLDFQKGITPFLRKRIAAIGKILNKEHSFFEIFKEISYSLPEYWETQTHQDDLYWFVRALAEYGAEYKQARLQFLCQCKIEGFNASLSEINCILDTLELVDDRKFEKTVHNKFTLNRSMCIQLTEFGNLAAAVIAELEKETTK